MKPKLVIGNKNYSSWSLRAWLLLRESGIETPIVALTAHAMADERQRCLAAGCSDFATKPISRRALIETVLRNLGVEGKP